MEEKKGCIRLLNSSGTLVMDSVSVEYEDSFCLDTFGELIEQHHNTEPVGVKKFIIARVQTWDHKQPDKVYYSYYNAFQLNKILFQTQIYLGKKLIHRLRVLNPLTNTDIIGNVQYFIVQGKTSELKNGAKDETHLDMSDLSASNDDKVKDAKTAEMGNEKEQPLKTVSLKDDQKNEDIKVKEKTPSELEKGITTPNNATTTPPAINTTINTTVKLPTLHVISPNESTTTSPKKKKFIPKINTNFDNNNDDIIPPSPSVLAVESGNLVSWTIASPAVYECKDLDGDNVDLKKTWLKRKLSLLTPSTRTNFSLNRSKTGGKSIAEASGKESTSTAAILQNESISIPEDNVANQPTIDHTIVTTIPVGTVTQYAKPIPKDMVLKIVPPSIRGRRRSLSYLNSASATPRGNVSLREWMLYMKKDSEKLDQLKEDQEANSVSKDDFDNVNLEGGENGSGESKTTTEDKTTEEKKELINLTAGENASDEDNSDLGMEMYDALLFATDDDFLEKSKIRLIFKKNAVTPDDAKLFEMPEFTGENRMPDGQLLLYDETMLFDICFPDPPPHLHGIKKIIYQYKYLLGVLIIFAIFIPLFLIK